MSLQGTRNWVTHIYISNGDGVLEDRFSFAFYSHSSLFLKLFLCVTHARRYVVSSQCVQGCVVGSAKQNVTLREFPKERARRQLRRRFI